ncbi:hypothetical protein PsYK624_143270 [Phanerochaete sordida]|uniref:F-box domain-containing protein n=1 Tax=Phanerochaete sordida TaxID=48140 RepID=A0A9P3GMJ2_9APHY|nr:hypothetical protein PsYK624_143270 [Phanerochaete sordida]
MTTVIEETVATGTYASVSGEDRRRVEERIFAYEVEISRLKRVLNRGASVMRLPDELLGDVFELCRLSELGHYMNEEYRTSSSRNEPPLPLKDWITIAHVCYHWREVALGRHTFWSYITTERADCVATMITRSGEVPLMVDGRIMDTPNQRIVDMQRSWQHVLGVSSRVQSLRAPFPSPRLWRLTACSTPSFPNVDNLVVEVSDTFKTTPEEFAETDLYTPGTDFPHLRHLTTLALILEDARSFFRPTLRSLHLEAFTEKHNDGDAWAQLLETLAELPQLENLVINSSFQDVPTTAASPTALVLDRTVHLPHLQSLFLSCSDGGWKAALLLHNLTFPPQTRVSVRHSRHQTSEDLAARRITPADEHAALNAALAAKLGARALHTLRIAVDAATYCLCVVQGWDAPGLAPDAAPRTPPVLALCAFLHTSFAHLELGLAPLARVERLELDGRACAASLAAEVRMARAFRVFADVRAVVVSGGFVRKLLDALGKDRPGKCALPALQVLHVQQYRFGRVTSGDRTTPIALADLPTLLRRRYERFGHRLEKIVISECRGVKEGDVASLGDEVGEVVWDGLTGDFAY